MPRNYKIAPRPDPEGNQFVTTDQIEPARTARTDEIPIIDVSCLYGGGAKAKMAAAGQLAAACQNTGFFFIVNHQVDPQLISETFAQARCFFDLPREEKAALAYNEQQRGYKAPGNITIPGYPPDYKEVLDFGVDFPADHPEVLKRTPLHGPNQWPDLPDFRSTLLTYYDAVCTTGFDLLRLFALALDLEETWFLPFHRDPFITWRIMRYPPQSDLPGQHGTAPHTDFGTLTLLSQHGTPGLEIHTAEGEWIEAPVIENSFVVNIGDLMACWTNDRFRSTAHRVINRSGENRYSIPLFYNPGFNTVVECLPSCQSSDNPARYDPIHYGEYITGIYGRIFSRTAAKT